VPFGKDAKLVRSDVNPAAHLSMRAPCSARAPDDAARLRHLQFISLAALLLTLLGASVTRSAEPQPLPRDISQPIVIAAPAAQRWRAGGEEVWILSGNCQVRQGDWDAVSRDAVVWIDRARQGSSQDDVVTAYLESDVRTPVLSGSAPRHLERFRSSSGVQVRVGNVQNVDEVTPPIYRRALVARNPGQGEVIRRTQFMQPEQVAPPQGSPAQGNPAQGFLAQLPQGFRRVQLLSRGGRITAEWSRSGSGNEWIGVADGGLFLLIEGNEQVGTIDISADRVVIWMPGGDRPDLFSGTVQRDDLPLEVYLEGNIEFRQGGDRVVYADRMYYDVARRTGTILDAELIAPVPQLQGKARLRAKTLSQLDENRFVANGASLTTSNLAVPRYSVTSDTIAFEDHQIPAVSPFSGAPILGPDGQQIVDHQYLATSRNNFLRVEDFPIFYWPFLATNLERPTYFFNKVSVGSDRVFGNQIMTELDAYQLLGIQNPIPGTDWDISLDYLSKRGFGYGSGFEYDTPGWFGAPGHSIGFIDGWFIHDKGNDNLGRNLSDIPPETRSRGRVLGRHRQNLWDESYELSGEVGWISDFNFLQEYYEDEWDNFKDEDTDILLKRTIDNMSWSVLGSVRLNDFFKQTEWLPRADHYLLGLPLLNDRLTAYSHSNIAYARLRAGDPPTDPQQLALWGPLPGEANVEGIRAATRHEVDFPVQLGPTKIVPYALGELAYWGEDLTGNDLFRSYGQVGVRASLPIWKADPNVFDPLWNLNGLAHKVTFEGEFLYADASQPLQDLALYDPLTDNAQQQFQREFAFLDFGVPPTMIPPQFDPRFYAVRTGLQRWVSSPSTEIADDLMLVRGAINQRWQTRRGIPGQEQIVDWISFDLGATWFPKDDQNNFGEPLGLVDYSFRWHIGERFTLLSDGIFDFFDQGQSIVSVGGFLNRPPNGAIYVGYHVVDGPVNSQTIAAAFNYRMSEKWLTSLGTSFNMGDDDNVTSFLNFTRVGESFNVRVGFTVDDARDNFGVTFAIEPRFMRTRLDRADLNALPTGGLNRL